MGVSKDTSHKTSSSFPEEKDIFLKLEDGDTVNSSYLNQLFSGTERAAASIGVAPITYDGIAFPSGVDTIDEVLREMSRIAWGEIPAEDLTVQADDEIVLTTAYATEHRFYQDYNATASFPAGRFTKTNSSGANPDGQIIMLFAWQNNIEEREGRQQAEDQPPLIAFQLKDNSYGYLYSGPFQGVGETPDASLGVRFTYDSSTNLVSGFSLWDCRWYNTTRVLSTSWTHPAPTDVMYRNSFGEKLVWCAIELPF